MLLNEIKPHQEIAEVKPCFKRSAKNNSVKKKSVDRSELNWSAFQSFSRYTYPTVPQLMYTAQSRSSPPPPFPATLPLPDMPSLNEVFHLLFAPWLL